MKLIVEQHFLPEESKLEVIQESDQNGKKNVYIQGPYMMYGQVNKNGRLYTEQVMRKELDRYLKEKVQNGCAYGELNHPEKRSIDLNNVCHLIKELKMESDGHVYGKSIVTNTTVGNNVKGLLEAGANLGVSSRGLGSLKENGQGIMEVQNDFHLVTAADVVADPSAPKAFVNGIMEGVEYFFDESSGDYLAQIATEARKEIEDTPIRRLDEEKMLDIFERFLHKIHNEPRKPKEDLFEQRLERFKEKF